MPARGIPYIVSVGIQAIEQWNGADLACKERFSDATFVSLISVPPSSHPVNIEVQTITPINADISLSLPYPDAWGSMNISLIATCHRLPGQLTADERLDAATAVNFTVDPLSNYTDLIFVTIGGLQPAIAYNLSVALYNTAGIGPYSAPLTLTAADDGNVFHGPFIRFSPLCSAVRPAV